MDDRPGCLGGLLRLAVLAALFNFLEDRFGFGQKRSCCSLGCGLILLFIFIVLACGACAGTDWFSLF